MKGTVRRRGVVAEFVIIATEDGGHALVELFGTDLDVGDVVRGTLDVEGSVTLRRSSDASQFDALVQCAGLSWGAASAALDKLGG